MFPRIKEFNFNYDSPYEIPDKYNGRLDLIALERYGDYRYYKAILSANNISMPLGFRTGVRPVYNAMKNEFSSDESIYLDKVDSHRTNSMDWLDYSNISSGYISEITSGKYLSMPTAESATRYMNQFAYITK